LYINPDSYKVIYDIGHRQVVLSVAYDKFIIKIIMTWAVCAPAKYNESHDCPLLDISAQQ
jgi:hypothetical protein